MDSHPRYSVPGEYHAVYDQYPQYAGPPGYVTYHNTIPVHASPQRRREYKVKTHARVINDKLMLYCFSGG